MTAPRCHKLSAHRLTHTLPSRHLIFRHPSLARTRRLLVIAFSLIAGAILLNSFGSATAESKSSSAPTIDSSWSMTGSLNEVRLAHTATLLPNGKVLVAGGLTQSSRLADKSVTGSAELYDPATEKWSTTGSLNTARVHHTATLLPNGKVLVVGGDGYSNNPFSSAELYDPATGLWSATGSLHFSRSFHTATLLPNGKVLVAGGRGGSDNHYESPASAELYDPASGTWTITGSLNTARAYHTATLLSNGKVLITGGVDDNYKPFASAELFDPATGKWSATASLNVARYQHTAILLPDGKVLVAGGEDSSSSIVASAELYDPTTGTWSATGSPNAARAFHTATLLQNGKVLIAGQGRSAELYDPASGTWSATASLNTARSSTTATLLQSGKVLVAGGLNGDALDSAELYESASVAWGVTSSLNTARAFHTATLLANGKVLIVGGFHSPHLSSAELYDPATGVWSATGSLNYGRAFHTATLLPNGKVLVVGGSSGSNYLSSAELYDPATGMWSMTGSLNSARGNHAATLLPNGKVLVVGGESDTSAPASAEVYDPATETWSMTGSLNTARNYPTATLLPSGKVLVAGGFGLRQGVNSPLISAELYDPATGTWSMTGSLSVSRVLHTATLLPNGKVLVVGGSDLASCEVYDPATEKWSSAGSLNTARYSHTATLLPNGKVLVNSGVKANNTVIASAEVYDPATGTWSATGSLNVARRAHTATLLPNGKVLVAGGRSDTRLLSSAELYDSAAGAWSAAGSLHTARSYHTATLLSNGKVLVVGGRINGFSTDALASAEIYDPATNTWTATGSLNIARAGHTATLLPNGKVLVTGGRGLSQGVYSNFTSAEVYDPASGTWSITGSLNTARSFHTATLLPNGKVLVAGGDDFFVLRDAEVYDPASGTWSKTGSLTVNRSFHTATLLPSGQVLIAGGATNSGDPTNTSELYNPGSGTWTITGFLNATRSHHTATLLPNGKVLTAGGQDSSGYVTSAELYDLSTNTWTATGSLTTFRIDHTATLLPNGKVLVVGGNSSSADSAELYDPANGRWNATASFNTTRYHHTETLLPSGKVLVAGGNTSNFTSDILASAELYDTGLGFTAASQPVITSATSSLHLPDKLLLNGTRFRGASGSSSDNTQSSSTNYPVVQLLSLVNEQTRFLLSDPSTNWSDASFTSQTITGFPTGQALVTVFTNGIPSDSKLIQITGFIPARLRTNFSDLSSSVITYGTETTTLSGRISAGGSSFPTGIVSITLGCCFTQQAAIHADGTFSANVLTKYLAVSEYRITYSYGGNDLYENASDSSQTLTINQATPVITWNNPANITVGTPLSSTQLNATADVPGTFKYSPPAGTVFNSAGTYQLAVSFTPSDTYDYTTAAKSVQLTVDPAPTTPALRFSSSTYTVSEASGHVAVTVNRTGNTSTAVAVNYATSDTAGLQPCSVLNGVASSRCDYATTVGTLQFAAGETAKTIFIPIVNDSYVEGNESFAITLSNPVGAVLGSIPMATVTIMDDDNGVQQNPISGDAFFIRQLYIDFLDREPEPAGLQGWLDVLHNTSGQCKLPTACDRISVALGFVRSPEFQDRGYFIFRFYTTALGRNPGYSEFIPDMARVSGFLNSSELEANKSAFVDQFMDRPEFKSLYDSTLNDPTGYVDNLLKTVGLPNHPARNTWIAGLTSGTLTRAQVLRQLVESTEVYARFYNQAFIVMQYFGFLRRDPDAAYQTWIDIFNHSGDYRVIVSGFINSPEYALRFGP